ncbi:MAG: 2,3-dihydroxybenzoate---[aryl-carrier protein] ligase [Thermodesulfobacteriota bacterium]|nr:2,3-dihydroxybenzoate---[aryl-carrier protein] ligase [Thermodesulfobacteriota bacterium]
MEGFIAWPREFAQEYRKAGYWIDKTIPEVMEESFVKFGSRTALITSQGTEYTYEELGALSTRLALHLKNLGLSPSDRLVLQMPNIAEVVISYLATLKAGAIPIMALSAHREAEIGYFAELSEARALGIAADWRGFDYQDMAASVQAKNPNLKMVLVTKGTPNEGYHSIDAMLQDPIEQRVDPKSLPRPDPDLPAVLLLSGGTTGIPKLIPRTHNDYVYNFLRNAEICELDENTVSLIAIPQEHNFALACPGLMGVLSKGGCEILSDNPSPQAMMELIERYKVTHCVAVPTMIVGMLNHSQRSMFNLSSLKTILTGGSKLNPEIAVRIRPELGCEVQQVLGMAEGPLYWIRLNDPEEVKLHTQGRPQSAGDEFKIVDPTTGKEVDAGKVGELWCRGPHTIRGYYRAPDHNARAFTDNGFYKSGDLVRLHHSGNVVVEGRIKDCINRGGEKISDEEVENHILAHPAVANCAYVAMPDPVLGERACAYVILRTKMELTLKALNDFLLNERRIAKFKLPERLEVLDAFPLTAVGKINKNALRDKIAGAIGQERCA